MSTGRAGCLIRPIEDELHDSTPFLVDHMERLHLVFYIVTDKEPAFSSGKLFLDIKAPETHPGGGEWVQIEEYLLRKKDPKHIMILEPGNYRLRKSATNKPVGAFIIR